jgi:Txe/YoeB family toxin of Txe-Axe toxin-antitoxin module
MNKKSKQSKNVKQQKGRKMIEEILDIIPEIEICPLIISQYPDPEEI